MAYKISTRNVFATHTIATEGGTSLSDPIDLRDISQVGTFSLAVIAKPIGAAATAGTTSWTYKCAQSRDGIYTKPAGAGTVGTGIGTAGSSDIYSFSPILSPFIKFQVIAGTGGGVIDADLNVR